MADLTQISVPDLGDFDAVEVIEVLVKVGDQVELEDSLVTLESDKATMDVPASSAGVVTQVLVGTGDSVSAGTAIVEVQTAGETVSDQVEEASVAEEPAGTSQFAPEAATEVPVTVPDLGDFDAVEVIEVLVTAGDVVEAEQGLITLESEKATMDVPSPQAGTVVSLTVSVGDSVSSGSVIGTLSAPGVAAAPAPAQTSGEDQTVIQQRSSVPLPAAAAVPVSPPQSGRQLPEIDEKGFSKAHASPSVRKFARELGANLAEIRGTGKKGRITEADIKVFVKSALTGARTGGGLPSVPEVDFARFGSIEVEKLSRIQKISGLRLHASWVNLPHVTQHDQADVTETEAMRKSLKAKADKRDIKLTPLAFIVRATVLALAEFPRLASSLSSDGQSLVMKQYRHIGFAADTPNGLMVPVIRAADSMDIYELAAALSELSAKARDGKLALADMQGGVFTISSLGGIGGTAFTPIINAPEVGILGVSKMETRPVYRDGAFVPRLMVPFSLSYDHRVIDGAYGVRFTTRLGEILADVNTLVEAIP
jgi:pyruvate dehydrogenase E2 component (dihydrolipoamide acetyltransferase)